MYKKLLVLTIAFIWNHTAPAATNISPSDALNTFNYCTPSQNERQCQKMSKYNSRAIIKQNYEQKSEQYCDNEIFNQQKCRDEFVELIRTGCVSEAYVKHLLFAGTPEQYDRTPANKRTYEYFPLCSNHAVMTFCKCGCFDKSVSILMESKENGSRQWTPVVSLTKDKSKLSLLSLAEEIEPNTDPKIKAHPSFGLIVGKQRSKNMYTIATTGSRSIKLTSDHPLLTENNRIVLAKDLKVGSKLYTTNGEVDHVAKIIVSNETLDVYNVETPASLSAVSEHLIFANDLIVGDLALQHTYVSEHANKKAREP